MNSQAHKFYFDNPSIWEGLRKQSLTKEVTFVRHFLERFGSKSILDVGCGSGAHAGELAKLGCDVSGVDLNEHMIEYAQKTYPEATFQVGDMSDLPKLSFKEKFDCLLCLCTTFSYNTTMKEIEKTLKSFYDVITEDAFIIIEVFNPIAFLQKLKFEGSFFKEDPQHYADTGLRAEIEHVIDEKAQTLHEIKKIYSLKPEKYLRTDETTYRLFFPQDMRYILAHNGFQTVEQYGKYYTDYLSLDSTRMITVATKR